MDVISLPKTLCRAMTYSIVARDAETGSLGVAVQSCFFGAGRAVPWLEADVGAIASQARGDRSYGVMGLDLLRAAKPAPEVLAALLLLDQVEKRARSRSSTPRGAPPCTQARCVSPRLATKPATGSRFRQT